jgi:hypothetical protein
MQKQLLLLIGLLVGTFSLTAQETNWKAPCGTPPGKSAWLKKYQANPQAYQRNTDTILYVPMSVHLLGTDNGAGHFRMNRVLDALCKLNADFEEANIRFFLEGEIDYINNSDWFGHETVLEGGEMMLANNVDNTINTYFCSNAAGNCGYNLPWAGIALDHSCAGAFDDTWAHEVGHNLSVQHPFLGWEGGITHDGTMPPDYSEPAPVIVTYDYTNFKDSMITDTVIIDTAFVELVDGSNCHIAADGFCDTSPDYLALRWFCNNDGESPQTQTDPNGESFRSDGTLIMGYADDPCQSRFTPEQIAAMRANLYDEKPEYLYNQNPPVEIEIVEPALSFPLGDLVQYDNVQLEWEAIEDASGYVVEVSILPNFGAITTEYFATTNSISLPDTFIIDRTYYWKVRAFNQYSFCTPQSETGQFLTGELSNVNTIAALQSFSIFPNPLSSGNELSISYNIDKPLDANVSIQSLSGEVISSQDVPLLSGMHQFRLATDQLAAGLYFLVLYTTEGRAVEKIVIQ